MSLPRDPFGLPRAEHVGSLLRPSSLKTALDKVYAPGHTSMLEHERTLDLTELHEVEDTCIREVVTQQETAGIELVTDGELRRMLFLNSVYDAVEGTGPPTAPIPYPDPTGRGEDIYYPGIPEVIGRLRRIGNPAKAEIEFLTSITARAPKVSFPAGSWWPGPFGYVEGTTTSAYPDREEFVADVHAIQKSLITETIASGAGHVQFDFPPYVVVGDETWRRRLEGQGIDIATMVARCLRADRDILTGLPEGVTTALHICRGNYKSRWIWEGSLEPVAEQVFNLPYNRFLVEWEDASREGDFSALRHVPPGPTVLLGIVSSKDPELETRSALLRKIEEASAYLDISQLGIAPQCGFASSAPGNVLSEDVQWRKLELVCRIAEEVWA
ncbi:hypothetical protein [Pseudonocardia spinosispora]|uniref:hypothetical protein n=1 Tax=Pseudonocardia spinosispora TaxID=103441 RepID=UPI0003FE6F63|nr:hypothetical protein [Pseudonocardia spinosispora]